MGTVLNITAISTGADTMTCAGHGQVTGAGPVAIYAASGTLPTGAPAINPVTDYWLIVVDANTLKLADSSAHALAGTAIDITATGSAVGAGALQVLIGLPYRRPRTATAGTQIKSADDNSSWDAFVAVWNFMTGQAQAIFAGIVLAANQHGVVSGTGRWKHGSRELVIDASKFRGDSAAVGTFNSAGHYVSAFTGAGLVIAPVELEVGKRITSFEQFYSINASGVGLTPALKRINLTTGTITPVFAGSSDNTGGAGVVESQLGAAINHVVLSGEAYFAEVTIATANHRVHGARVIYDDV